MAHRSAIVHVGDVRVEVLAPSLLRLEYSPSQHFENSPTVNALNRRMPVPPYSFSTSGGWLTVRTASATLRYKLGSGPFTPLNTSLRLSVGGRTSTVAPTWDWECTFGQVCQAGAATLGGGATLSQTFRRVPEHGGLRGVLRQTGSQRHLARHRVHGGSGGGVVAVLQPGEPSADAGPEHARPGRERPASADHRCRSRRRRPNPGRPSPPPFPSCRGPTRSRWSAPLRTASIWASTPWRSVPAVRHLPSPASTGPLGGWFRGFDTDTYNDTPTCGPGQSGDTCQAGIQPLNTDGLLDTAGWRLLDDTQSAVWTAKGWIATPARTRRPRGRLPLRLRTRLRRCPAHLGPAHRSRTPPSPERLRRVVLRLHAVFEQHHRELGLSRVRHQPGAAQHPLARHRLEGAQRLERLGMEPFPLPLAVVLPQLGALPRHRRDT